MTLCSTNRQSGLTTSQVGESILHALRSLQLDGDIDLHCATLMPDHVHLLFTLKERLTLGQVVGKLKSATQLALKSKHLQWQNNYFDHRLREQIPMEDFARYIFLNPYRKGLLPCNQTWPWWTLNRNYKPEFIELLNEAMYPPPEWLEVQQSARDLIESDSSTKESDSQNKET